MAEFLIRVTSTNSVEPGDIIYVQEDGATWGAMETIEHGFGVIRVLGLSLADAQQFIADLPDDSGRRYKVNLSKFESGPPSGRFSNTGFLEITLNQAQQDFLDKLV